MTDFFSKSFLDENEKRDLKPSTVIDAFAEIEKHNLVPSRIICTVCGCMCGGEEQTPLCNHLRELAEGME